MDVALSGSSGNPPVRNGASWLDFATLESDGVETLRVWRVSKFAQSPFHHWGFRDWELRGEANNDFIPLPPLDLRPTASICRCSGTSRRITCSFGTARRTRSGSS